MTLPHMEGMEFQGPSTFQLVVVPVILREESGPNTSPRLFETRSFTISDWSSCPRYRRYWCQWKMLHHYTKHRPQQLHDELVWYIMTKWRSQSAGAPLELPTPVASETTPYMRFVQYLTSPAGTLQWRIHQPSLDVWVMNDIDMETGIFQKSRFVHVSRYNTTPAQFHYLCDCRMYSTVSKCHPLMQSAATFGSLKMNWTISWTVRCHNGIATPS